MSGKSCLVTGATSGIGKETALRLAAFGAAVTIVARDEARGAAAAAEIRQRVPRAGRNRDRGPVPTGAGTRARGLGP